MRDDLIGVTRSRAAQIIGVSERRLIQWNRSGLVMPSSMAKLGTRIYSTYSLEELVQGRVVVQLEEQGVNVQVIRRLVDEVRSPTHPQPLASLRWATDHGEVFVAPSDGDWLGGKAPNQYVVPEVLNLRQIRISVRETATKRPEGTAGKTERRRGVLGSKPVFAGTRIPVRSVIEFLERDLPDEAIIAAYPDLTENDIDEARRQLVG